MTRGKTRFEASRAFKSNATKRNKEIIMLP